MKTRKEVLEATVEQNSKQSLGSLVLQQLEREGTVGRTADKKRRIVWRRLLNCRDEQATPDSVIHALLESHYEAAFASALVNGQQEAMDKESANETIDGRAYKVLTEGLVTVLGTRTAALKAFSPASSQDDDGI